MSTHHTAARRSRSSLRTAAVAAWMLAMGAAAQAQGPVYDVSWTGQAVYNNLAQDPVTHVSFDPQLNHILVLATVNFSSHQAHLDGQLLASGQCGAAGTCGYTAGGVSTTGRLALTGRANPIFSGQAVRRIGVTGEAPGTDLRATFSHQKMQCAPGGDYWGCVNAWEMTHGFGLSAISANGAQVLGVAEGFGRANRYFAASYEGDRSRTLDVRLKSVAGIDDRGTVAGTAQINGQSRAARAVGTQLKDLGTLGGSASWARAISPNGRIAGCAERSDGSTGAFITRGDTLVDLAPGVASCAHSVNNAGQAVGVATLGASQMSVLFDAAGPVDLLSAIPLEQRSDWTGASFKVHGIATDGRIVASLYQCSAISQVCSTRTLVLTRRP